MFTGELLNIFQWWLVFFLTGLTFLPLTAILFHNFFDKGYIFSKILGVLLISYLVWLLSSLKVLPFHPLAIFLVVGIFLMGNLILLSKKRVIPLLQSNFKVFLLEEVIFTAGLIFWAYIKSFEPSIHGLEKFMDFGFINSILRTEYMPPRDIWLTPHSINYYYFGHFMTALLTKISGLDPVITYNLMLATLFGLTLTTSFSISANLYYFFQIQTKKAVSSLPLAISGTLGAFLVTLGGNLHTIYAFFQNYNTDSPVPFWQLIPQFNFQGYWYPNATRFIPFTIHEFPLYSFVVSDLHGHVLNIPFVLLIIALLIKIFFSQKLHTAYYILLALLIAISLMANVLDSPIYLLGIFVVLLVKQLLQSQPPSSFIYSLAVVSKQLAVIIIITIAFSLPFWLSFKPFGTGIGVLCAPEFLTNLGRLGPLLFEANHCARSPLWMLITLWGFPYLILAGFLGLVKIKSPNILKSPNLSDSLVLALAFFATLLILIPEFFYVKDIYPAHYRANTVFKFGYQAFIILGLISGYMITRIIFLKKFPYYIILIPFFILIAIYPYFAVNSYFGGLKNYQGLNGLNYLNNLYPTDYQAILWIRENISKQPVILEAQGDSYTDYARVSSNTGLPTVVGWPVHEWLWRGSYDEAGKRSGDVKTLYEGTDLNQTKQLLNQYKIEYVFIGDLERQKYQSINEEKFYQLGKVIFQSGNTRIYQLNPL